MSDVTLNQDILDKWQGKQQISEDVIDPKQANLMEALFDLTPSLKKQDLLPPLWHWIYFPSMTKQNELGRDGHEKLGSFLPPVALPRRQWAGSRLRFFEPLRIGEKVTRTSTIKSVELKKGRTGQLCFVTVVHEFSCMDQTCFTEEHDIVYREDPKQETPIKSPRTLKENFTWHETITPDPVQLFRYSALTYNSHRIHYDRSYCENVEGYDGLIVHGPLLATLLLKLALEHNPLKKLKSYEFRAESSLTDTQPFKTAGRMESKTALLWALNKDNQIAMSARAEFNTIS